MSGVWECRAKRMDEHPHLVEASCISPDRRREHVVIFWGDADERYVHDTLLLRIDQWDQASAYNQASQRLSSSPPSGES